MTKKHFPVPILYWEHSYDYETKKCIDGPTQGQGCWPPAKHIKFKYIL